MDRLWQAQGVGKREGRRTQIALPRRTRSVAGRQAKDTALELVRSRLSLSSRSEHELDA